ncbi:MAG: hypothetical protein QM739_18975 [Propionivibrio sp.]
MNRFFPVESITSEVAKKYREPSALLVDGWLRQALKWRHLQKRMNEQGRPTIRSGKTKQTPSEGRTGTTIVATRFFVEGLA